MNRKTKVMIGIVSILLLFMIGWEIYATVPINIKEVPVVVVVGDHVGVNLNAEKVYLGTALPGTRAERSISIQIEKPIQLMIQVEGIPFVYPDREVITASKGEVVQVKIVADVPAEQALGTYEGKVIVSEKRVRK